MNSPGKPQRLSLAWESRLVQLRAGSFSTLQEEFGLDHVAILKALGPSPGIAVQVENCGAVIRCLMAIDLVFESD